MISQEWIEAGRNFSLLDEEGRADYWGSLTSGQQLQLTESLLAQDFNQRPEGEQSSGRRSGRSGCGTVAIGCIGMVVGIVLVISIEIFAVMQGVQFLGNAFGALSPPAVGLGETPAACEDPEYYRANVYVCNPGQYTREWQRNREMNERDARKP